MTDLRPVLEQYNELLGILGRFTQHKMNMDEAIQVAYIIDKLFPSWKDFKHTLKHLKEELNLVELGSQLHIEESLKVQDSDKPKGNNVAGTSVVNMVKYNNSYRMRCCMWDDIRSNSSLCVKIECWFKPIVAEYGIYFFIMGMSQHLWCKDESVSIRRIQGIGYGVLGFLGVGTTFDIFQNIHILYLRYGVLTSSGYGVLSFIPLWSLVSAGTDTPYLP
ncbi:hypothetical protein Tco_0985928 [Tanacetum coccineum]